MPVDAFHSSDGKDKDRDGSSNSRALDGGRGQGRGGGRGNERRGPEDDRRGASDKEGDGVRRRPEPVPAAYGRDGPSAREREQPRGQSRNPDRERVERQDRHEPYPMTDAAEQPYSRGGARQQQQQQQHVSREREREQYPMADTSEQPLSHSRGGPRQQQQQQQQHVSRERERERPEYPERERERPEYPQRERERPEYPIRDRDKQQQQPPQQQQQQRTGDLREQLNQQRHKEASYRDRSPAPRQDQSNGATARTPPLAGSARPSGSAASNPFFAELRRAGQSLLEGRRTPEARLTPEAQAQASPAGPAARPAAPRSLARSSSSGSSEDRDGGDDEDEEGMEAGEIRSGGGGGGGGEEPEAAQRKRRQPAAPSGGGAAAERAAPSAKAARVSMAPGNQGLLSRVIDDVASFKALQAEAELDFDPDAPAAVKSSPSGSEERSENELDARYRQQREAAKSRRALQDDGDSSAGDEEDGGGEAAGVKSRWLVDADAAAEGGRDAAGRGGAGGSGSEPEGGGGGVSSSDDEDSLPPSPRSLLNKTYNMLQECRGVEEFEKVGRISEGTYGVVYKAREKSTGRLVALKMIKMEKEKEGFPVTSIREINVLLNFHHPNIVHVSEIVVNHTKHDQVFMVMELMDHDLKSILEPGKAKEIRMSRPFSVSDVKNLMIQLLRGVSYLHNNWVLHRDLKTSNILYNTKGELKICDFGLARQYGSPLKPYTLNVVTLWYRAPELLFGSKIYSTAVDMWSVGCIMGELLLGAALMPGQGEFEQIDKIVQLLGTPKEDVWPGLKELPGYSKVVLKQVPSQLRSKFQTSYGGGAMVTEAGFDLLSQMLAWDPAQRLSADDALEHRWFKETPLPQKQELMPTFAPR